MCQHSDTAQCKVTGNSNTTHTKSCYFNVLQYLTSPKLTARQSTYSPIYNSNSTGRAVQLAHPSFGNIYLMVVSFTPLHLYLLVLLERRLCGLLFRFASLGQEKCLLPLLDIDLSSLSFPACSLVTVLTELPHLLLTPHTQLI